MSEAGFCKFSDRAVDKERCDHLSVIERYYTPKYRLGKQSNDDGDHCVLLHSNKVLIVTLAPSHPILRDGKTVTKVDYQVNKDINILTNKVEGKSKKGAYVVSPNSTLGSLTCADGSQYTVRACVNGQVVEVNANIVDTPDLINRKPQTEGYIGMLLCKLKDFESEVSRLLSSKQYEEELSRRQLVPSQAAS